MVCPRTSQLELDMYVEANAILGLHSSSGDLRYGLEQEASRYAPVPDDPQLVSNLGVTQKVS